MVSLVHSSLTYHIYRVVHVHLIFYRYKVEPLNERATLVGDSADYAAQVPRVHLYQAYSLQDLECCVRQAMQKNSKIVQFCNHDKGLYSSNVS